MTETRNPETMLPIESKLEAEEIREFLAKLTAEEEKDFRTFMYGVKFVKSLERTAQKGEWQKCEKEWKSWLQSSTIK